ncbi:hypothetical protein B566_EDAN013486 [Ephemera danica]|nr:hypothetical protein B566_EDAN013486 [Ephemera danica]
MRLTYFVSPYDLLDEKSHTSVPLTVEAVVSKNLGHSVENSSMLPANFMLRLRSPMPMCVSLAKLIQQVTEVECGDLSAPQPLLSLLTQHCSAGALDCSNNKGLFVTLPDQQHCYFLTEGRGLGAVLVQSIPFTHPAHVPQVLALLRQQALFNTLVASCVRPTGRHVGLRKEAGMLECDTLLSCRCLSIPITMRALIHKWQGQTLKTEHTNGNFNISLGNFSLGDQSSGKLVPDFDGKGSSKSTDQSNGTLPSHGQLGTVMSHLSHSYSSNLGSPEVGLVSSRDSFFPSSQLTVEPLVPGQKPPPVLLNLLNEQQKAKKRKRKLAGDPWAGRSPKRKMSSEDCGGELSEDTQGSTESSTPLGTPTQAMDVADLAEERPPVSPPDTTMEPFEFDEESATSDSNTDMEELRNMKKLKKAKLESRSKNSSDPKNFSDNHQAPPTIILDLAENKSLVAPSVSITPISAASLPSSSSPAGLSSMLTGMGLERRPGIEIIPIGSSPSPALPSSITITPIKPEERSKERSREDKLKSRDSKKLDEKRLEKKRKRRREGSPSPDGKVSMRVEVMGPPQAPGKGMEKLAMKQDTLSKPVSVNLKTCSPSTSPPLSSSTIRKFATSPTHVSSSTSKPMSLVKTSTSPTPKPPKTSQSPKHSSSAGSSPIYGSPKHTSASPKHSSLSPKQSGSGKPSMSALKSASSGSLNKSSSSSSSSSSSDIKFKKDKEKKSSSSSLGHSSPKSKSSSSSSSSSSVKLKQPDFPLSGGDAPLSMPQQSSCSSGAGQTGASLKGTSGSSPPSSSGGSTLAPGAAPSPNTSAQDPSTSPCSSATAPKCQVRNRKGSLSAVIDKLKSAQHYTNEPTTNPDSRKDQTTSDKSKKEGSSSSSSFSSSSQKSTVDGKSTGSKTSEYQVKSSSDGIKITINKTQRNKSSLGSRMSSLPSSPKTSSHTGLKPGVISGPASKKTLQKPSSSKVSSPNSSSMSSKSLSSSSSSSKQSSSPLRIKSSSSSPKSSGATDLRKDKPRPKSEKSIFSKDRKLSPSPHREESDGERAFKLLAAHAKLDTGLPLDTPKLDPKFQIPKLSRNSESKDSDKKSADRDKVAEASKLENPKVELKRIDEKDKFGHLDKSIKVSSSGLLPVVSLPSVSSKLSSSSMPQLPKQDLTAAIKSAESGMEMAEKLDKSVPKVKEADNTVLDLATKPLDPMPLLPPPSPKSIISKHPEWPKMEDGKKASDMLVPLSKPLAAESDVLLDFSSGERRAESKMHRNTPPPQASSAPLLPVQLPPALSPSVSVHIVKSPAPSPLCSPLVLPSPHSSQPSPCITDDELMDEALVGLGK